MSEKLYDLKMLCATAQVTPRTVHFYIQAGLLPPAGSPGPGARYDDGHLARLQLIRFLQKEHLPLSEIRKRLSALDDSQTAAVLEECKNRNWEAGSSALDYVRSVLYGERKQGLQCETVNMERIAPDPQSCTRSQWERIALSPEIELHIRRPLSRDQNRRMERLLASAREIFKEEKS